MENDGEEFVKQIKGIITILYSFIQSLTSPLGNKTQQNKTMKTNKFLPALIKDKEGKLKGGFVVRPSSVLARDVIIANMNCQKNSKDLIITNMNCWCTNCGSSSNDCSGTLNGGECNVNLEC